VRSLLLRVFIIIWFLSLSYRHTLHSTLTSIELEIKVHNIWVKHCDTIQWDHHSFMFLPSSHSCLFHTDTHCTQPVVQWNWRSRCTIFGWSIATQYSEIITPSCFYHHLIPVSFIQTLTTLNLKSNQIGAQGAQYFERLKKANSHLTLLWWFKCRFQFSDLRLITNRWNLRDIHNYALVCVCCISW